MSDVSEGERHHRLSEARRAMEAYTIERQEFVADLRSRLAAGYNVGGCMWEVEGRQCQHPGMPIPAMGGLLSFCSQHREEAAGYFAREHAATVRCANIEQYMGMVEYAPVAMPSLSPRPVERGVYVVGRSVLGELKIGRTGNRKARLSGLRNAAGFDLEEVAWFPTDDDVGLEAHLHAEMADCRIAGSEWFKAPDREAFMARVRAAVEAYDG